jgi:AbrB family looped-hinge helix DNA binding protein
MEFVTVQEDGQIQIPEAVRERLGIHPGTRLELVTDDADRRLRFDVVPEEAQLVEKSGAWVIRSHSRRREESEGDWVACVREERMASLIGDP